MGVRQTRGNKRKRNCCAPRNAGGYRHFEPLGVIGLRPAKRCARFGLLLTRGRYPEFLTRAIVWSDGVYRIDREARVLRGRRVLEWARDFSSSNMRLPDFWGI